MVIAPEFHMRQYRDDVNPKDAPHFTRYKSKTKGSDIYGYFFEVYPECNSCFNSFVSLSTAP